MPPIPPMSGPDAMMPEASPMQLGGESYPEEAAEGDTAEQGYSCEGKFPLTDPMWTNDVKQGQP